MLFKKRITRHFLGLVISHQTNLIVSSKGIKNSKNWRVASSKRWQSKSMMRTSRTISQSNILNLAWFMAKSATITKIGPVAQTTRNYAETYTWTKLMPLSTRISSRLVIKKDFKHHPRILWTTSCHKKWWQVMVSKARNPLPKGSLRTIWQMLVLVRPIWWKGTNSKWTWTFTETSKRKKITSPWAL